MEPQNFLLNSQKYNSKDYSSNLIGSFTHDYILANLAKYKRKFVEPFNCEIFCFTWNFAGKMEKEPLIAFMNHVVSKINDKDIKTRSVLIFITFQEIVDLNASSFLTKSLGFNKVEEQIETLLRDFFNEKEFFKVISDSLFGLYCVLYASSFLFTKTKLQKKPPIAASSQTTSLGMMRGMIGNKGAVGISIRIKETWICFIGCHLTAHFGGLTKRNMDLATIEAKLIFTLNQNSCRPQIGDHDIVILAGDLNYRINVGSLSELENSLKTRSYDYLLKKDQLIEEMKNKRVLEGWHEQAINFPPSYKIKPQSNTYYYLDFYTELRQLIFIYNGNIHGKMELDDPKENKILSKLPAYCDRILYKVNSEICSSRKSSLALETSFTSFILENNDKSVEHLFEEEKYKGFRIKPVIYDSFTAPTKSDHNPVFSKFESVLEKKNKKRYKTIKEKLEAKVERWKSTQVPRLNVSSVSLVFAKAVNYNANTEILEIFITNPTMFGIRGELVPCQRNKVSLRPEKEIASNKDNFEVKRLAKVGELFRIQGRCYHLPSGNSSKIKFQGFISTSNCLLVHEDILNFIKEQETVDNQRYWEKDVYLEIETFYGLKVKFGAQKFLNLKFQYKLGIAGVPLEYLIFRRNTQTKVPVEISFILKQLNFNLDKHMGLIKASKVKDSLSGKGCGIAEVLGKAEEGFFDFLINGNSEDFLSALGYILLGLTKPLIDIGIILRLSHNINELKNMLQGNSFDKEGLIDKKNVVSMLFKMFQDRMEPLYFETMIEVIKSFGKIRVFERETQDLLEEFCFKKRCFAISTYNAVVIQNAFRFLIDVLGS